MLGTDRAVFRFPFMQQCCNIPSYQEKHMDILNIIKARHSVRKYQNRPVDEETLSRVLEAAHAAPTAANRQPVRLLVIREKEQLEKLGRAANIYGAPVAVVACACRSKAWTREDGMNAAVIDASILTDHMMLEAASLGLGSVWICWFKADVLKRELDLPDDLEPVNILALGWSAQEPADPDRHDRQRIPMTELLLPDSMKQAEKNAL